ncbi:diguanylate cyclase [Clostridia bacterium]|nr:diguanylate cyclase [Clostridia bacterium]
MLNTEFSAVLLFTAAILLNLSYYGYKRRHIPGAKALCLLMLAMSIQTIGYAFEIMSSSVGTMLLWVKIEYIGISFFPVLIMYFIREYLDEKRFASSYVMLFLLAQNILTLILVWTNSYHFLYYSSYNLSQTWGFNVLVLNRGIWYYVHVFVFYMVAIYGTYRLFQNIHGATGIYRRKTRFVFYAISMPMVVSLAYLFGIGPKNIDITIFSYVLIGILIAYGLYEHDILYLLPLTQKDILNAIDEAVIVLDDKDCILDYNAAASKNFNMLQLSKQGDKLKSFEPFKEFDLEQAETNIHYNGRIFGSKIRNGQKDRFRILVIKDNTNRENAYYKLKWLANRDVLTSLYNRRYFMELFECSMKDGVVAILDIDHFKNINDTYGHKTGDNTLIAFSKLLQDYFKNYPVCRYGGEEFAIFAEDLELEELQEMLQHCQTKQENNPILKGITFSAGISSYRAGYTEVAIVKADEKLYEAKKAGRNKVIA